MTRRKKVLVVDDSVVVRRAISAWLSADLGLEVVATASTGKLALERLAQNLPDLVLLDIEMPEMDGIEALRQIRARHPDLPVLIFSVSTERGAMRTLDALGAGASDYVTKPASVGAHALSNECVRMELLAKIHALTSAQRGTRGRPNQPSIKARQAAQKAPLPRVAPVELLVLGASTGGPSALHEVLSALPSEMRVPVLLVQHMPPMFTRIFAERLNTQIALDVREAVVGEVLTPGRVWVAPGDFHMTVVRDGQSMRVGVSKAPPENSCRPAVDVLFRSAAACFGPGVLAVVLTGMGRDGLVGCQAVRDAGGCVVVQDEPTSIVWSMPGCVAKAGLADSVLPLREIGPELLRRVGPNRREVAAPSAREDA